MRLTPIAPEAREFYSSLNYSLLLIDILEKEIDKRIIRIVKKLGHKDAKIFLKKVRQFDYERRYLYQNLRMGDTQECNQIELIVRVMFKLLRIRIP